MTYREVSTRSYGSRILGSIVGAFVGVGLFLASFPVLFFNEGHAVHVARTLESGASSVVSVAADKVDPANEGKLVHITAPTATDETLADKDFGIKAKALRLSRKVEMYQYKEEAHSETKRNVGGNETTVTTYTYPQGWHEEYQGNTWKDKEFKGKNPAAAPPYKSELWKAGKVTAGAFELTSDLADRIHDAKPLKVGSGSDKPTPPKDYKVADDGFLKAASKDKPTVGDVRVTYQVVELPTVSIVDVQAGKSFKPYVGEADTKVELLEVGEKDAASMIKTAVEQNNALTWFLRLAGFLMMAFGLFLVMRPISMIGDIIPLIGSMVGALLGVVALFLAAGLSLITVSIGWVFYRPLIGIPLLAAGVGGLVLVLVICVFRPRRRAVQTAELADAPPAAARRVSSPSR